jgi:ATP-dependent Lon protease
MAVVVEPAGLNFSQRITILIDTVKLPVLPLDDIVVLPGMVVPLRLADAEVRAAIEAGRAAITADSGGQAQVLLVPRLDGKYASVGAWGVVEQIGRLPGGDQAALVRSTSRARIGTGTTGPGAALWVEATVLDETAADDRARELAREYRGLVTTILQRRGAWQVIDSLRQVDEPGALADLAGYAS